MSINATAVRVTRGRTTTVLITFPDGTTCKAGGSRATRAHFVVIGRCMDADELAEWAETPPVDLSTRGGRQVRAHTWTLDPARVAAEVMGNDYQRSRLGHWGFDGLRADRSAAESLARLTTQRVPYLKTYVIAVTEDTA